MKKYWSNHPELKATYENKKTEFAKFGTATTMALSIDIIYTIPTVVHVMHNNGPENISDEQIRSQIDVLNEDFGKYGNGFNNNSVGTDTKIRFCLASKDPFGNPTDGINRVVYKETSSFNVDSDDVAMKNLVGWDPDQYLNIWVVNSINYSSILGYAYYATGVAGQQIDGMVISYAYFGRTGNLADSIVSGRTATHEIGHYLNLLHPWAEGDCSVDDGFSDTPNCNGEYYSNYPDCPKPIQCGNERMIENYMDYSDDDCMNIFTTQQSIKMRETIVKYRSNLVSASNLEATGCISCTTCGNSSPSNLIYIYPNPTNDLLIVYLDINEENDLSVNIYDELGQIVVKIDKDVIFGGPIFIDVSELQAGIYLVKVNTQNQGITKKIIKN